FPKIVFHPCGHQCQQSSIIGISQPVERSIIFNDFCHVVTLRLSKTLVGYSTCLCSTVSALIVPAKSLTKSRLSDCSAVGPPPANRLIATVPGAGKNRGKGSAGARDRFVVARRRGARKWSHTSTSSASHHRVRAEQCFTPCYRRRNLRPCLFMPRGRPEAARPDLGDHRAV